VLLGEPAPEDEAVHVVRELLVAHRVERHDLGAGRGQQFGVLGVAERERRAARDGDARRGSGHHGPFGRNIGGVRERARRPGQPEYGLQVHAVGDDRGERADRGGRVAAQLGRGDEPQVPGRHGELAEPADRAEHPELLAAAGAEVVTFDPLRDEKLPGHTHGLVIGGGFPEEHAADLSANASLRAEVAALAGAGAPVIAECAGLLYLSRSLDGHPMCGVLEVEGAMTSRLTLGYRDAVAATSSPLGPAGTRAHGHEFHRTAVRSADGATNAWHWTAAGAAVTEGFVRGRVHASYLHTHWNGLPGAATRITAAAREYRGLCSP